MKVILASVLVLFSFSLFGQSVDFINTNFSLADSIALLNANTKLKSPDEIATLLVKDLKTEEEKFRAIFRWITATISYDTKLFWEMVRKEEKWKYDKKKLANWQKRFIVKQNKKVIKKRTAICYGYANLLEHMCHTVGIECVSVDGYTKNRIGFASLNHAWNAVKINGKWYLTDPTWASGYTDEVVTRYSRKFNRIYFLADPAYFVADHYPRDKSWLFLSDKPTLNDFLSSPLKHEGFYKNKLVHLLNEKGLVKADVGKATAFGFTTNLDKVKSISVEETKNGKITRKEIDDFIKDQEGFYRFSYFFDTKGTSYFNIYVNSYLTLDYNVNVN